MSNEIQLTIDGKSIVAKLGQTIVEAARDNNVYIPTLCDFKNLTPAGTCRVCSVKVDGRVVVACGTRVASGMVVENESAEMTDTRKAIIEMLFVEGNHMCPTCEKSGNCELQAIAYHYRITAPRFPFLFPKKSLESVHPLLMLEHNRCIQCRRCVRGIRTKDGKGVFAFKNRSNNIELIMDKSRADDIDDELAAAAANICPVGAIIKKGVGFSTPIGERTFDKQQIGESYGK